MTLNFWTKTHFSRFYERKELEKTTLASTLIPPQNGFHFDDPFWKSDKISIRGLKYMGSIFSNCLWVKWFSVGENDWKNSRTFLGPKSLSRQNFGYLKLRGSTTSLIESGIQLLKTEPLTKKPGIKHKPFVKCLNSNTLLPPGLMKLHSKVHQWPQCRRSVQAPGRWDRYARAISEAGRFLN